MSCRHDDELNSTLYGAVELYKAIIKKPEVVCREDLLDSSLSLLFYTATKCKMSQEMESSVFKGVYLWLSNWKGRKHSPVFGEPNRSNKSFKCDITEIKVSVCSLNTSSVGLL